MLVVVFLVAVVVCVELMNQLAFGLDPFFTRDSHEDYC